MSTRNAFAAIAALGFLAGRLTARATIRKLSTQAADLRTDVEVRDMMVRTSWRLAYYDRLTGLPNRSMAAILFLHRELLNRPTVAALIDLDRFKHTNDTYGHHVGDDLLRTVAGRLTAAASTHRGTAARLAGDEFLLLLPAGQDDPGGVVAEVLTSLAQPATLHTDDGDITVQPAASAGIAVYDGTDHADSRFDTLLWHADIALYHAKQHRNTVRIYHAEMRMPRTAGRHGPRLRDQHTVTQNVPGGEVAR